LEYDKNKIDITHLLFTWFCWFVASNIPVLSQVFGWALSWSPSQVSRNGKSQNTKSFKRHKVFWRKQCEYWCFCL